MAPECRSVQTRGCQSTSRLVSLRTTELILSFLPPAHRPRPFHCLNLIPTPADRTRVNHPTVCHVYNMFCRLNTYSAPQCSPPPAFSNGSFISLLLYKPPLLSVAEFLLTVPRQRRMGLCHTKMPCLFLPDCLLALPACWGSRILGRRL